jgi:hypothetical protein
MSAERGLFPISACAPQGAQGGAGRKYNHTGCYAIQLYHNMLRPKPESHTAKPRKPIEMNTLFSATHVVA